MSARLKTLIGIMAIIAATIWLHYTGRLLFLERFIRHLAGLGSGTVYQWTIRMGDAETFHSTEELQRAYMSAKKQLLEARSKAVHASLLEEENASLREQLKFFITKPIHHVGAEVIGRSLEPIEQALILNRGAGDGIAIGQSVIVGNGILVGKIVRVEPDISLVRLLSDGQSKVAATVLNQTRSVGLVEGGYGISVRMNFIPQNESVSVGDTIITSGLEPSMPRGLLIGTVEAVEKEAYQPFASAVLTPLVALDKILTVAVILAETSVKKL